MGRTCYGYLRLLRIIGGVNLLLADKLHRDRLGVRT